MSNPILRDGHRPMGSRGEGMALSRVVECRFGNRYGIQAFILFTIYPLVAIRALFHVVVACSFSVVVCSFWTHARLPLPWCSRVPRGPLYQLVGPRFQCKLLCGDQLGPMLLGTDRFLGCRLRVANDSTCISDQLSVILVPCRIS
jgi:hypothetical protein